MFKEMITTSCMLCLFGLNTYANPPIFKNYVIFGDSLTDVGNYTTSSNNCIYFNAPITSHTQNAESRYTNTTWANAGELKNTLASNDGGSNYAVAGYTSAQILTSVKNYRINRQADSNTLYIVWAGTNDVLYAIGNHWSDEEVKRALVDGTNNVILSLSTLYDMGARNFLVVGLMDLSQTPMSSYPHTEQSVLLGVFPNKEDKLRLQQACFDWNRHLFFNALKSDQNKLRLFKNKHSDSHIYAWNPTKLLADMIKNPTRYGYPEQLAFNTQNSKIQDMHYPTAQVTYCGNMAKNADRNSDHYMFYNFIHPTPSVYNIMEQDMMNNATELQS
jgi:phospholipase/lecithinase/hemolysin